MLLGAQEVPPSDIAIIVDVIEGPDNSIAEVIMAALGVSGVLAVGAFVLGLVLAFVVIRMRFRRRQASEEVSDHQRLDLNS